jgi:hypothetical protein
MGVSGQRHAPAALYPFRYTLDKRLGGPRAGLDAGDRRKILCPCRGSNPDRLARSQTLYCLSHRRSRNIKTANKSFKIMAQFKYVVQKNVNK